MNALARRLRVLRNRANKLVVQVQNRFLRNTRVLGRPFHLTLEPGNVCNLKCPLCPTPTREKRLPSGMLKLEDAKQIIDRFPYTLHLVLSNWGEPFLNRDIFAIIEHAKSRGITVQIESNFTLFDEAKARALVASKLDQLVVALDGASQETYEVYRVGGRFADIIANVELVRRIQHELGDFSTELVWKMVVNKHNEHEVDAARAHAEQLGMTFKSLSIWSPVDQRDEWSPTAEREAAAVAVDAPAAPPPCHRLWQSVSVNFNGDVFPCCSEFAPTDRLVNVLEQPFDPVWNSATYRERRRANRGPMNCDLCHGDKDTQWYRTWAPPGAGAEPGA